MQTKTITLVLILTFSIAFSNYIVFAKTDFSYTNDEILTGISIEFQNTENLLGDIDYSLPESPILEMPEEYLNYSVIERNGVPYAVIDGFYPMFCKNAEKVGLIMMVYPTPPDTENITISFNATSLMWSNFTEKYPEALHHTVLGEWSMIETSFTPSKYFTLTIHYEHPISKNEEKYQFLYDLNISPYLSPWSPNSTAYFTIRMDTEVSNLHAYTTETDTVWNPINYTITQEGDTEVVAIQMYSDYSKPLLGDLAVMFSNEEIPEFPAWIVPAVFLVVALLAALSHKKFVPRLKPKKSTVRRLN